MEVEKNMEHEIETGLIWGFMDHPQRLPCEL